MTRRAVVSFFSTIFLPVCFAGCDDLDPSQDEINKAKNIDLARFSGEVIDHGIGYYAGNRQETKILKGSVFYTITIASGNSRTLYRGVPVETFDLLPVGTKLPLERALTRNDLSKTSGRVVMMQADLKEKAFFVLVYDYDKYSIYRVSPEVFVEDLDIGTQLPMKAKIGSGAQAP